MSAVHCASPNSLGLCPVPASSTPVANLVDEFAAAWSATASNSFLAAGEEDTMSSSSLLVLLFAMTLTRPNLSVVSESRRKSWLEYRRTTVASLS